MKFTLESSSRVNLVRAYSQTELWIGEEHVRSSCIVSADRLITDWPPASIEALRPEHLEAIFALEPEVVLLGTGERQRFPAADIRAAFATRAVGLEVMDLGAACRTYNVLVQEERRAVAGLFPAALAEPPEEDTGGGASTNRPITRS
ncbi:MAG TPA: Mth938-like domain-containing protein [Steroidobacteraceae bacterium]|nr:Mth938-like domain-containing protein [Steroidobacteraceae bacterium]